MEKEGNIRCLKYKNKYGYKSARVLTGTGALWFGVGVRFLVFFVIGFDSFDVREHFEFEDNSPRPAVRSSLQDSVASFVEVLPKPLDVVGVDALEIFDC